MGVECGDGGFLNEDDGSRVTVSSSVISGSDIALGNIYSSASAVWSKSYSVINIQDEDIPDDAEVIRVGEASLTKRDISSISAIIETLSVLSEDNEFKAAFNKVLAKRKLEGE